MHETHSSETAQHLEEIAQLNALLDESRLTIQATETECAKIHSEKLEFEQATKRAYESQEAELEKARQICKDMELQNGTLL